MSVVYQGRGSEVIGWKCDGDPQPEEKVLQDIKERRGQERRLQEIQQQLVVLITDQGGINALSTVLLLWKATTLFRK